MEYWKQQQLEHKAWLKLFDQFCKEMGISHKQGNEKKYRPFFALVEDWGQEYARLRIIHRELGSYDIMVEDLRMFNDFYS